jgi:DNA-binding transcriptional MerR regulator
MTVSALARQCGVSRSTVLYYESRGLLRPVRRTAGNYRSFGDADVRRLQQIRLYRRLGLTLAETGRALSGEVPGPGRGRRAARVGAGAAAILRHRLTAIDAEIVRLRGHQRAILRLLQQPSIRKGARMITKDKWVSIMRSAGFSQDDMHRWHAEFEKAAPAEHQEFLEFLHIPEQEIKTIRRRSRGETN